MKWGEFDLHLISDGHIWLDGGAMFGVVPKPLWEKKTTPDESNRICLGLNCLLIRNGKENILIDTGCGEKFNRREREIYGIRQDTTVLSELRRFGLAAEDIHRVINTHLHFDHCGWNTRQQGETVLPTFPNAEYIVRDREYCDANQPNERTRGSYQSLNWACLAQTGQLRIIEEDTEIVPGVFLIATPGHTAGHQSIRIESQQKTLFYLADLCPTTAHIPLPWIMGYDQSPMITLQTRKEIYRKAVDEQWLLFFEHDPEIVIGYLQQQSGQYILHPQIWTG
jgi:glyoxylase-like metal-dependent hydrolase (beta-lactamase superfamily II)